MFYQLSSRVEKLAIVMAFWASLSANFSFSEVAEAANAVEQKITINLASRILTLYQDGKKVYMYHVGAGKVSTPTPVGSYEITDMEENPVWVDPKDTKLRVESGTDNPLGYRWMQFNGYYGIHGTNNPDSIGYYVSNGCIRLEEEDAEQLYDAVDIGTPVIVSYERIVIEQLPDGMLVYYIYPDGYGRQPLDVSDVRQAFVGYGLDPFMSDEELEKKIEASDGEPTYLGKIYRVEVDDKWISGKAIERDGITYVAALPLSVVTKINVTWNMLDNIAITERGTAAGYKFGDKLYVDSNDLTKLFGLSVEKKGNILKLKTVQEPIKSERHSYLANAGNKTKDETASRPSDSVSKTSDAGKSANIKIKTK